MKRNKSESLFEQAQKLMPGGVNSPVRAFKNVDGKPVFFKSAKGPTLIDEDDKEKFSDVVEGDEDNQNMQYLNRNLEDIYK